MFDSNHRQEKKDQPNKPKYEPPKIITYTEEQLIEHIGPAQACSPSPCPVSP